MKNKLIAFILALIANQGFAQSTLYVAPNGSAANPGTLASPTTLEQAITLVTSGGTIYMRGGTYSYSATILIARTNSGSSGSTKKIFAYNTEVPVLNFSGQAVSTSNRGIVLDGLYWHLKGLIIERAGDNGVLLSGNNNTIENCIFRGNNDSGLQLSRYNTSYTTISQWPANNLILGCEAYDNKDPDNEDADGFAAKLTSGTGNVFRNCVSHHNIDDGWDLYTKSDTGPIGAILLENCIAHSNGTLTTGGTSGNGDKNGFKLGGEDISVNHTVRRCVAFLNGQHGFTYNRNLGTIEMSNNTAYNNTERNFNFDGGTSVFKNNLSYFSSSHTNDRTVGTVTGTSNAFWSSNATTNFTVNSADFVSLTPGANSAPTTGGFLNLASGSDLINAGVVTTGITYGGSAPDVGAIESGGTTTPNTYTLTTASNPAAGGSITRSPNASSYTSGTVVTLTATPASGYTFTGWSGSASGAALTTTVTVNANLSVTANFTTSGGGSGNTVRLEDEASPSAGYCSADGSRQNSYAGASNGYYINLSNSSGKGINWNVSTPAAGTYTLTWRYSNAGSSSATTARALVNGSVAQASIAFPKTSSWSTWTTTATTVTLAAGVNTIRLETTVASEFAIIDWLEVSGNGPTAASCSATARGVAASGSEAENEEAQVPGMSLVAYPNPSRQRVTVRFSVEQAGNVGLAVYTTLGKAERIGADTWYAAGTHDVDLDVSGMKGVYVIVLSRGKLMARQRIVVE